MRNGTIRQPFVRQTKNPASDAGFLKLTEI
jgi:hypothetical protein